MLTEDVNIHMHLLEIEITTVCNQNCEYCYNRGYENINMPFEEIIEYIKFAEKYEVGTVVISGGEASMHPEFERLCDYLVNYHPKIKRIVVQSNGYIKNIPIEKLKGFDSVHLSYEKDETSVRTFSVEENIGLAKKMLENGIYTYLFSTVTSKNIDNIDLIVDTANNAKIDVGFNLCCDTGKNKNLLLSKKQKYEVCQKLYKYADEKRILPFKNPLVSIFRGDTSEEFIGVKGGCSAGIGSIVVTPFGDVYPCPFFRISVGNTKTDSLLNIWRNSSKLKCLRARKYLKEPCGKCEYLSFCGGCRKVAFEQTGDILGSDPTCFKDFINV